MANIKPFSPFRSIDRFNPWRELEESFKDSWSRLAKLDAELPAEFKLDVAEDEKSYTVKADLPGVNKDDIQVAIDGDQVSISAETKSTKEEKGKNTIRSERYYGKQYRSFVLGSEIDAGESKASYKDGVLELTLPKKARGSSKKLKVS